MIDYKLANSLAAEALEFWGSAQIADAADRYERAIGMVETYPDWHGAYAGVLQQLGRHEEATREYETALALNLKQGAAETDPGVKTARYFLADHLTKQGEAARALEVLTPAVSACPDDWLIGATQALALWSVGRLAEAKAAAEQAISNAGSETKKVELTEYLSAALKGNND